MESVCNVKGSLQNSLRGHSPSDRRLCPFAKRWRELGEELGEGREGLTGRRFCCDSSGNFEDQKLWSRFSRLFDDYLDLHLFCMNTLMPGRLTGGRSV